MQTQSKLGLGRCPFPLVFHKRHQVHVPPLHSSPGSDWKTSAAPSWTPSCPTCVRASHVLRAGHVLQVHEMVVAWVGVFVVHLPGIPSGWRTKEGVGDYSMHKEICSTHLQSQVARRMIRTKRDGTPSIADPTVRTDLPSSKRCRLRRSELPIKGANSSSCPPLTKQHGTPTRLFAYVRIAKMSRPYSSRMVLTVKCSTFNIILSLDFFGMCILFIQ